MGSRAWAHGEALSAATWRVGREADIGL